MITITFATWMIPAGITLLAFICIILAGLKDEGIFGGLVILMVAVPALFISMLAWMVWGILK